MAKSRRRKEVNLVKHSRLIPLLRRSVVWVSLSVLCLAWAQTSIFGTLEVNSDPRGAEVFLDGVSVGNTPLRVNTRPGRRSVRLELAGYVSFESTVTLETGDNLNLNALLNRSERGSSASSSSPSPSSASPSSPSSTSSSSRVSDDGLEGSRAVVSQEVRLRPEGSLSIRNAFPGSTVFINNNRLGSVPDNSTVLVIRNLPEGSHTLRLNAPNMPPFEQRFQVIGGETTRLETRQVPNPALPQWARLGKGLVTFTSSPRAATLHINGRFLGITPTNPIPFDEGNYEIRFSLPGFRDQVQRFSVEAGSTQIISAPLDGR